MTNETSLVADTVFCPHITFEKDNQEVMRITADKIVVAPGVSVDDAAKCVIECLEKHIASMFSQKDLEIKNLKMALKPFAGLTNSEEYIKNGPDDGWCSAVSYQVKDYKLARAAIKG